MVNRYWNQISSEIHTDPLQQASFRSQGSQESNIAHPRHQTVEHKSIFLVWVNRRVACISGEWKSAVGGQLIVSACIQSNRWLKLGNLLQGIMNNGLWSKFAAPVLLDLTGWIKFVGTSAPYIKCRWRHSKLWPHKKENTSEKPSIRRHLGDWLPYNSKEQRWFTHHTRNSIEKHFQLWTLCHTPQKTILLTVFTGHPLPVNPKLSRNQRTLSSC